MVASGPAGCAGPRSALESGNKMPVVPLGEADLQALVAFLGSLE